MKKKVSLLSVSPVVAANSTTALRSAMLAQIGITALPAGAVTDDMARSTLVPTLRYVARTESGICAVYASHRLIASKVRRFVDTLAYILRQRLEEIVEANLSIHHGA